MTDKPFYLIACGIFFAIAVYLHEQEDPKTISQLIMFFILYSGTQFFGWFSFLRAI